MSSFDLASETWPGERSPRAILSNAAEIMLKTENIRRCLLDERNKQQMMKAVQAHRARDEDFMPATASGEDRRERSRSPHHNDCTEKSPDEPETVRAPSPAAPNGKSAIITPFFVADILDPKKFGNSCRDSSRTGSVSPWEHHQFQSDDEESDAGVTDLGM